MKRPTFLEGVAVTIAASLLGGAFYGALTTVLPGSVAFRAWWPMMPKPLT